MLGKTISQVLSGGCVLAAFGLGYGLVQPTPPVAPAKAVAPPVTQSSAVESASPVATRATPVAVPTPTRRPHDLVVPPKTPVALRTAQELARLKALHAAAAESDDGRRVFSPARPALKVLGPLGSTPPPQKAAPLPATAPSAPVADENENRTVPQGATTAAGNGDRSAPVAGTQTATVTQGAVKPNAGTVVPHIPGVTIVNDGASKPKKARATIAGSNARKRGARRARQARRSQRYRSRAAKRRRYFRQRQRRSRSR